MGVLAVPLSEGKVVTFAEAFCTPLCQNDKSERRGSFVSVSSPVSGIFDLPGM